MKRRSTKREALIKAMRPEREAFLCEFDICMVPGCAKQACDVHEIIRGGSRAVAYQHRCTWLALCRRHHDAMDDYSVWPPARQMALKLIKDKSHFDLVKCNKIKVERIDPLDVLDELKKLL